MKFSQFSQWMSRQVARPWFFALVAVALVAWIPTLFFRETGPSDLLVDALTNPLSLLLLVLLQNSQYRSEKAKDDRQDALEDAVALLLRHAADDASDVEMRSNLHKQAVQLVANARKTDRMASGDAGA